MQLHFIIGSGRSGTTLLSQALNAHPNIVASPEGKFMLHYWQHLQHRTDIGAADIELFMDNAFKIQEHDLADFRIWLINQPKLKQALLFYTRVFTGFSASQIYSFGARLSRQHSIAPKTWLRWQCLASRTPLAYLQHHFKICP